jgi:hypothetical protein
MLEALLARVRERAAAPRERTSNEPRQAASAAAITEAPPARAVAGDEEIEEYDEELIEIIDDGDVESAADSDADRPALPLELSASAPSIELRRPAPQPSPRLNEPGPVTAHPPSVPAGRAGAPAMMSSRPPAAARPAPEAAPLQAETAVRRPVAAANVVHAHGARPAFAGQRFIDLLDASLQLGN